MLGKFFTESGEVLEQPAQRAVNVPSLEVFRDVLNGALGNIWCGTRSGGWWTCLWQGVGI